MSAVKINIILLRFKNKKCQDTAPLFLFLEGQNAYVSIYFLFNATDLLK